jgi:hypothetical protein
MPRFCGEAQADKSLREEGYETESVVAGNITMQVLLKKKLLRRDWSRHPAAKGLLLEHDIGVGHGRLRAKLLVFRNCTALRRFWRDALGRPDLGRCCRGAVNGMFIEVHEYRKRQPVRTYLECDPRYFCVIGLVRGYLSMEIISHEAVHAGFNYAKRKSRTPWDEQAQHMDEEAICYPSGRIAAEINRVIHMAGLYDK